MLKIKDVVKTDAKGRVVLPKSIRRELNIDSGEKFDIILTEDNLIVLTKR